MDQDPLKIQWDNEGESHCLLSPRMSSEDKDRYLHLSQKFQQKGHIWLCSSGSSSSSKESVKLIALSKMAFLASAKAVNDHLEASHKDIWGLALPSFHVGGLSIFARAYLSQSRIYTFDSQKSWNAENFYLELVNSKVTLLSLVPTQINDLVELGKSAPSNIRGVITGGAATADRTYKKALEMGWPILPSFGMTEACSQVATAELSALGDPRMRVLPHLQVKTDQEGVLLLKGSSLLTGYAFYQNGQAQWVDPKSEGWLETQDRVQLDGQWLKPLGRGQDFVQIGGETVNLKRLRELLLISASEMGVTFDIELVAKPDQRLGSIIILAHDAKDNVLVEKLMAHFNKLVLPYERIRESHMLSRLPRSELGKIRSQELLELISY